MEFVSFLKSRTNYYAYTGVVSVLIFIAVIMANADITGFWSLVLTFGKFIPLALAGLSVIYYLIASKGGNDNTSDLGLGFAIGKSVYYAGVAGTVILTFLITIIGAASTTGFLSVFHDILSVLALIEIGLTYMNYLSYTAIPTGVVVIPASAPAPIPPTTTI